MAGSYKTIPSVVAWTDKDGYIFDIEVLLSVDLVDRLGNAGACKLHEGLREVSVLAHQESVQLSVLLASSIKDFL